MKSITSLEEAYNLPEKTQLGIEKRVLSDGTIVHIPHFRAIVAEELTDDSLLYFVDKGGRVMCIGYDSEGAYKYEA